MTSEAIVQSKCNKTKNPCKICFERVGHKNGLRCEGACKRWVHFKCLNYTPGKIADIKAGIITVTCPCPDCFSSEPKEYITNAPYTCSETDCPANQLPKCNSSACQLILKSEKTSEVSIQCLESIPSCVANKPRPFRLCQPSGKSCVAKTVSGHIETEENYKKDDIKKKNSLVLKKCVTQKQQKVNSNDSIKVLCPNASSAVKLSDGKCAPLNCNPKTCKNSGENAGIGISAEKSKSLTVVPNRKRKNKNFNTKKICPPTSSDSMIQVSKGQDSLISALDEMCNTIGKLADQIKQIMYKLDGV